MKKELKDIFEIIEYMKKYSNFSEGTYLDEARLLDDFSDCKAVLKEAKIEDLSPKQNLREVYLNKIEEYGSKNIDNSPPILIKNNKIVDGHHRYYNHLNNGKESILVYELVELF